MANSEIYVDFNPKLDSHSKLSAAYGDMVMLTLDRHNPIIQSDADKQAGKPGKLASEMQAEKVVTLASSISGGETVLMQIANTNRSLRTRRHNNRQHRMGK